MSKYIVDILVLLLRKACEEGEDIALIDLIANTPNEVKRFCLKNFEDFLDLPPRVFFAKIMNSKKWSKYFKLAAERFYEELIKEV